MSQKVLTLNVINDILYLSRKRTKERRILLDRKKIAETLVSLRGDKTQKEVSADLGISISALAMYEQGNRIPRDEVKIKISKYFGKSVQEIFF